MCSQLQRCDLMERRICLFNNALNTFFKWLYCVGHKVRIIQTARAETHCHHYISYFFLLAARVILYAPCHRQDTTYQGLCYTSCGALAVMRNSSLGPPWETDPTSHHTMNRHSTTELHLAPCLYIKSPLLLPEWVAHDVAAAGFHHTMSGFSTREPHLAPCLYIKYPLLLPEWVAHDVTAAGFHHTMSRFSTTELHLAPVVKCARQNRSEWTDESGDDVPSVQMFMVTNTKIKLVLFYCHFSETG